MQNSYREDVDKALFNEKSLSLLNIRDLRDIGRKFGIPSPTTMKKKDLVDEILKIVYGVIEVPVRNTCGRPSSREFNMSNYIKKIKNNSDMADEISKMKLDMDYGDMMLAEKSDPYEDKEGIEIRVFWTDGNKCFLRVCEFVESEGDIEVSKEFAEKFGLSNLDVLEILETNGLFKIVSKNGVKVADTFKDFELCGVRLKKGKSQNFYLGTNEEIKNAIEKLANECVKTKTKLILFAKEMYHGEGVTCLTYSREEDKTTIYRKLVSLAGLCKRELMASENIVVVVEEPDELEASLSGFDEDIIKRVKDYLNDIISNIVKLGNIYINISKENSKNY